MLSDPGHGGWCAASCCLTAAAPLVAKCQQ